MFGFQGREADGVIIGQTVGKWWVLWCTTIRGRGDFSPGHTLQYCTPAMVCSKGAAMP